MGKTILTPTQSRFLESIQELPSIIEDFYFTGGTALSEFYLKHRLSEDIDLFSYHQVGDKKIDYYLDKIKSKLNIESIEKDHIMGLFSYRLTYRNGEKLKIDFNEYEFTPVESSKLRMGKLTIDSFYDIAINKAYTISGRFRNRDFIDLYYILRRDEFSLEQVLSRIPDKFGVQIDTVFFAGQLLRAADLPREYPKMLVPFKFDDMVEFFKNEAKRLGNKAFRK